MRNAPQGAFNTTQDDGHVLISLFAPLGINNSGSVGTLATNVAGRVGVVTAHLAICGVTVDHRVHVARCHPKKQVGLTQRLKRLGTLPVGLRDDTDPKPLVLKHAADDRHPKTGVINVSVTRHNDDVATVPAELIHLVSAHWQKRCHTEALRPILAIRI